MNFGKTGHSRFWCIILSVLSVYGFIPQRAYADVASCSNGVEVQQYNLGSDTVYDLSYGGEVMTVSIAADGAPMYDRITIDDQLVLEFWSRYNSQGEKVLDYSTFSFQGWTATRDGSQLTAPPQAEQPDGETQDEQLHPNVVSQAELVQYAMSQLHSSAFLDAIGNTTQEHIGSNGMIICILAMVAFVHSIQTFIGACGGAAPLVGPCVLSIVYFAAAGVAMACTCSETPDC